LKLVFPESSSRRAFLQSVARGAGAAVTIPYFFTAPRAGGAESTSKNDRPHVGVIGAGGRGSDDLRSAARFGPIVAIADVDRRQAERARETVGGKPELYGDFRKLLDRKDIDVVVNGTPDHWHTAVNISACEAGKDVYAEKPLTLTIDEGRILIDAVRRTGRIVQVGTQQRSERQFQTAVELVRNGRIGKLRQVWVALPYFSTRGGPFATVPVPPQLDWDMYQGQAPEHEYCPQRTHANFRWWYEYAGGIVTDWGNHHVDIAHWGMDCELSGPLSVEARGLFPNPRTPRHYNTPDRFFSRMLYANGVEVLYFASLNERLRYGEVQGHQDTSPAEIERLFGKDVPDEIKTMNRNGIMFIGDRGRVFVNRGGVYGKPVDELRENPLGAGAWRVRPDPDHMGDFFQCVKSRKEPASPVWIQHRTITACHLTNLSLRLGRKLAWDPQAERITGDAEADSWRCRPQRERYRIAG
jgi:predicted dehydrogenase